MCVCIFWWFWNDIAKFPVKLDKSTDSWTSPIQRYWFTKYMAVPGTSNPKTVLRLSWYITKIESPQHNGNTCTDIKDSMFDFWLWTDGLSRTMRSSVIHLAILKNYINSPYIHFKMWDIDIHSLINHISHNFLYLPLSFYHSTPIPSTCHLKLKRHDHKKRKKKGNENLSFFHSFLAKQNHGKINIFLLRNMQFSS